MVLVCQNLPAASSARLMAQLVNLLLPLLLFLFGLEAKKLEISTNERF